MAKQGDLWVNSALINAFDDAISKYKCDQSRHLDDLVRRLASMLSQGKESDSNIKSAQVDLPYTRYIISSRWIPPRRLDVWPVTSASQPYVEALLTFKQKSHKQIKVRFLSKTLGMWSFYNSFKIDYKREHFFRKVYRTHRIACFNQKLFDNHTSDLISSIIGKMEMHHFIRMIG
ncbi:hypothetical protein TorRG33x02_188200 [Trema orientale]|uniref:Survival Motor Neuron Gemin2-binding domain-containing protein n=1 Tax=Trema orientale TaxID=63057 RepID=A0A2P5EIP1_TREOI|nr:hypothetical protein TorRG33x02_188200 [Trema orientale]